MATILMPLPSSDFDPSETGVPWRVLSGWPGDAHGFALALAGLLPGK